MAIPAAGLLLISWDVALGALPLGTGFVQRTFPCLTVLKMCKSTEGKHSSSVRRHGVSTNQGLRWRCLCRHSCVAGAQLQVTLLPDDETNSSHLFLCCTFKFCYMFSHGDNSLFGQSINQPPKIYDFNFCRPPKVDRQCLQMNDVCTFSTTWCWTTHSAEKECRSLGTRTVKRKKTAFVWT